MLKLRWAVGAAAVLTISAGFAAPAAAHMVDGITWAVRKPALAPAPGPGLFQMTDALPASDALSAAAAVDDSPANSPQAIGARTGIAPNVIMRARVASVDRAELQALVPNDVSLARMRSATAGPAVRFALFADADFWVAPQSMERTADGMLVWIGKVVGHPQSSVSVVIKDNTLVGDVFLDGRSFKIRTTPGAALTSVYEIVEVDENAYTHGKISIASPDATRVEGVMPGGAPAPAPAPAKPASGVTKAAAVAAGAPVSINILVAYSANVAARAAANGSDVRTLVQNALNVVSSVWSSSGVNATLVPTIVAADSSLPDGGQYTIADHLNFLSGYYVAPNASYAALRKQRDAAAAPLVQLIVVPGTGEQFCGIAGIPSRPVSTSGQHSAFSVIRNDCLGSTNAHEIGHNLSLNHDRTTDKITSQTVYNVGWIDSTALTRDVMSYANPCPSCVMQRLYSSPVLTVNGRAFGVAAGGVDPSDGVTAVNESLDAILAYRPSAVTSPDATQPEMAVTLTTAAPQASTSIAFAQAGRNCTPSTTGAGTVWFTHTPPVTGTSSFVISNITGSDNICAYPSAPTGVTTYSDTGASSPYFYQSMQIKATSPTAPLQLYLAGTAGVPIYVGVNSLTSGTLPIIGKATTAVPQNGWWWDPAYPGIGFALETSPSSVGSQPNIFLAGFFYDTSGNPVWGTAGGTMSSASSYSGSLSIVTGGNPYGSATKAPTVSGSYGSISLNFTSPTQGTLVWPGGTLSLRRFSVDTKAIDYSAATGSPGFESGWYWVNNDGGRGMFVEQMGTSLFMAIFQYTSTGQPTWQIVSGSSISNGTWQGNLVDYSGGTAPTTAFRTATQRNTFGTASVSTRFPSTGYRILYNSAAPTSFPSTYYSAVNLTVTIPGTSGQFVFDRYRF